MLRAILETPLTLTDNDGKRLYPKDYRVLDAIVQWLWPTHIVTLSYAGEPFSDLVQDQFTIFRYVFRHPDQRTLLHNRAWQRNPVGMFLDGYSAANIVCEAEQTYLQVAEPIFDYLNQSPERILNNYPQTFERLWTLVEYATEFWHSAGYYAVLAFACEMTTNACLFDSSELARTIHAFNTHIEYPALKICLSSVVDYVNQEFVKQGFGAPVPLMALFIGTMCDSGLAVCIALFEAFIKVYRAGKNATSWYVKDAVWETENKYQDAIKAEQIPDAVKQLTIFALESGTERAIEMMIPLYLDLGLPVRELPAAYVVYRSRFSPICCRKLTAALIKVAHYPAEGFFEAALTTPRSPDKYILHRNRMARLMTIQSIVETGTPEWLSQTVIVTALDTDPDWASRILAALCDFEPQNPQAKHALKLACKLDMGVATQMAIVMVDNDPDRAQIVQNNRSNIHQLLVQAAKHAKHNRNWKPVVLRLGAFIDNKLEEISNKLVRPITVIKGRKRASRVVMIPSPLAVLVYNGHYDLIEPFCQNMTHAGVMGRAMFLYMLKQNQQAYVPVLARCLGVTSFPVNQLQELCDRFQTEKAIAIIREFCPVERLGQLLHNSIKLQHIRDATLAVMRQNGFETVDIINALLETHGIQGSKSIASLAEELYGEPLSAERLYKAFCDKDDKQLADMIRLYCPVVLYSMPQDLWETLPKVWSSAPASRQAFDKPPPNLLAAIMRYRRKETFDMLSTLFPETIRLCCEAYEDCVCEACWLSETDMATQALDLWPGADYKHIQDSVLTSIYEKLPHASSSSD